jgi:hypothetical protein
MFQELSFASCAVAAVFIALPAQASDIVFPGGGTLAQIIDGGGTNTIFTIANLDAITIPYTLSFYDDSGNPLTLSTTAGPPSASLSGTLAPNASLIIQTNGKSSSVLSGYATLATNLFTVDPNSGSIISPGNQIAGSAVFGLPLPTGTFAQASCPLDTGLDSIIEIPFDDSSDATAAQTGIALVNSFFDAPYQFITGGGTARISATFFSSTGTTLALPPTTLTFGQHLSFLLDQQFPQLKGQKGLIRFTGTDTGGILPYFFKVLGVRATATTYTSIAPLIPCNFKINPQTSQPIGCTN